MELFKEILFGDGISKYASGDGSWSLAITFRKSLEEYKSGKDLLIFVELPHEKYKELQGWPELGEIMFKKCEVTLEAQDINQQPDTLFPPLYVSNYSKFNDISYSNKEGKVTAEERKMMQFRMVSFYDEATATQRPVKINLDLSYPTSDLAVDLENLPKQSYKVQFKFI